jgi:membrane-associated phospholipid phosphatase
MRVALILCAATAAVLPARAQEVAPTFISPDAVRLDPRPSLDERVRNWWQAPARQRAIPLRVTLRAIDWTASPGVVVVPPLVWGAAAAADAPATERVARRTTEAVLLGAATTGLLKVAFGRARPSVSPRSDDWATWRGASGGGWQAFPSGHTTVAFAAAATWIAESRGAAPVALGAAGFATGAGLARMYFNKHWLTDVLAGAAVGTLSALTVQALHRGGGGR